MLSRLVCAGRRVTPSSRLVWAGASGRPVRFLSSTAGVVGEEPDSRPDAPDTTHFGFQEVPTTEKQTMVNDVFHRVAKNYDIMNDVMSGTMHRCWKDTFVDMAGPLVSRKNPTRLLDVAGGTGDIAFRLADVMRKSLVSPPAVPEIVVADINPDMLAVGQDRAATAGYASGSPSMSFQVADAQDLPFESNSFDLYTIAFGIRNVPNVPLALSEAFRVLKPGGRFMCLEFSHVTTPGVREVYDAYSFNVIPTMGEVVSQDRDAYQYLVESIRQFPDQETFKGMIDDAGFMMSRFDDLTFGVVAVHSGFKPL